MAERLEDMLEQRGAFRLEEVGESIRVIKYAARCRTRVRSRSAFAGIAASGYPIGVTPSGRLRVGSATLPADGELPFDQLIACPTAPRADGLRIH